MCIRDSGKGKLTGMNGMQYKLKRTDEGSSTQLVDTVEVDAGEYNAVSYTHLDVYKRQLVLK